MTSTATLNAESTIAPAALLPGQYEGEGLFDSVEADFEHSLTPGSIKGAIKSLDAGSKDLWLIDPRALRVIEGFNPRVMNDEYRAHIRTIADSIKTEGFYQDQPLAGYVALEDGKSIVYIYAGHTRLKATLLAISEGVEVPRVPVSINQKGLSMEDMTVALIRGNGGRPLTFFESAVVVKRLLKMGFTDAEVTARTGLKQAAIDSRLKLMAASKELRELVANDSITGTLALQMLAEHGDGAVAVLKEAQARAASTGKTKVRLAQTETSPYAKIVKKESTKLYEAVGKVHQDPAFAQLSPETREVLEALMADIKAKAEAKAEAENKAKEKAEAKAKAQTEGGTEQEQEEGAGKDDNQDEGSGDGSQEEEGSAE